MWCRRISSPRRCGETGRRRRGPSRCRSASGGCARCSGPTAIETVAGGYRLALDGDDVDGVQFEHLIDRARVLRATGEPDRAAASLARALSLWRGRPFDELDGWLPGRSEAARLEELRRAAEEDWLDARLAAGEHREVVVEAEALVAEEPLRERRWAILALAQYRCGRQADALRSLARARTSWSTQLGIDPGAELVALEAAILRQDPTLSAVPEPAVASEACPYKGLAPYDVGDDGDLLRSRRRDRGVPRAAALDAAARGGRTVGVRQVVAGAGRAGPRAAAARARRWSCSSPAPTPRPRWTPPSPTVDGPADPGHRPVRGAVRPGSPRPAVVGRSVDASPPTPRPGAGGDRACAPTTSPGSPPSRAQPPRRAGPAPRRARWPVTRCARRSSSPPRWPGSASSTGSSTCWSRDSEGEPGALPAAVPRPGRDVAPPRRPRAHRRGLPGHRRHPRRRRPLGGSALRQPARRAASDRCARSCCGWSRRRSTATRSAAG